jgi:hypothetical protein
MGAEIFLSPASLPCICPVAALHTLFTRFPAPPDSPLFCRLVGPFSRAFFIGKVKSLLLLIGLDPSKYSGHSLRKGAAVSAAMAGISKEDIKILGRWRSDAVDIYINETTKVQHRRRVLSLQSTLLHS